MIKEKLYAAAGVISTIFAAIFYVLFQQKKDENNKLQMENLKKENEIIKGSSELHEDVAKALQRNGEKASEELKKATSGNSYSNAMAGLDLLRK